MAAIARTTAAKMATMTLGWNEYDSVRLTMGGGAIAEDDLAAETAGDASIGLAISRFHDSVKGVDAEKLRLGIISASDPMLIEPVGNGNLTTVLMPCFDSVAT